MIIAVLIVLFVLLIGVAPIWPHSNAWGYMPFTTTLLIILLTILLVMA